MADEKDSGVGDVLAALAGPVVGAVGNIGLGALSRSWEQEDWSHRTSVLNKLARENAEMEPLLKVRGMKLAGLNPALANGGSFSGLAPAQGSTSASPLSMQSPDFSKLAQNSLIEAQTRNLESQTRSKNIENKREIDKDLSANAQFRAQLENWLKTEPEDSDKYASAKWLLAQDSVFSLGSIEGSERAMQWREAYSRTTANEVGNKFAQLVSEAKIKGQVPEVLAKLDHWQLKKLGVDLAEAQTRILALGLGMDETKANINKIIAETANIIEDTDLKHFQSFAKLVRSGEGLNAALVFLDHGMMALASNLPIASTNFAMRKMAGRLAPTTEKYFKGLTKFDSNSSVKPKF